MGLPWLTPADEPPKPGGGCAEQQRRARLRHRDKLRHERLAAARERSDRVQVQVEDAGSSVRLPTSRRPSSVRNRSSGLSYVTLRSTAPVVPLTRMSRY